MLEKNEVYLDDYLDLMKRIAQKSVDFIFADILYNTTAYDLDLEEQTKYEEASKAIRNVFEQDDTSTEDVIANLQSLTDEIELLVDSLQ